MQINQKTERSKALETLMAGTVSEPKLLTVVENEFDDGVEFYVRCSARDYGKLIGGHGANVIQWSKLANAACQKDMSMRGSVIVETPPERSNHPREKFVLNPKFNEAEIKRLLNALAGLIYERGVVEVAEVNTALVAATITAYGYISREVDTEELVKAIHHVVACLGGANGRKLKVSITERFDS